MVFSSPIFLFLFLPAFLLVYYFFFIPVNYSNNFFIRNVFRHICNTIILCASILFYCWGEKVLVFVMLFSTVIDYLCGLFIAKINLNTDLRTNHAFWKNTALFISIFVNLSILIFFKYFNFGIDNINNVFSIMGLQSWKLQNVLKISLPLGISFYTFQSMSYTIDVYRGQVKATKNFLDFACFVTMFPQLVAGPIVRYKDIAAQIIHRKIKKENIVVGVKRFIIGLGKKVLIANTVAVAADGIFSIPNDEITTGLAWIGIISYTLQIYFDFSGYSDMAIGLGKLLGFNFPENFNYPYSAQSIQDFWRRWHISLSTWFRDYLYIPLGGSKCSTRKIYFNLVIVFTLCGLWHGASWTFIVWGLFHGIFLVLERIGLASWLKKRTSIERHVYVMLVAMCGWVFFRAETFSQALTFFKAMIGISSGTGMFFNVFQYINPEFIISLVLGIIFSFSLLSKSRRNFKFFIDQSNSFFKITYALFELIFISVIMFLCYLNLSSGTYNPFIYFRF